MIECLECGKKLNALKHTHFKFGCSGNLKSLQEYKTKYPNAKTVSDEIKSKLSHSEQSFISRYGEVVGQQKWLEYTSKLSEKNSLQAFLKKGKTEEDWKKYNSRRAITIDNLVGKYGEIEGKIRWDNYRNKQKDAGNTLSFFIDKYGENAGAIKYAEVCKAKGITLENMIRVHGAENGFIKYHAWLEKTKGNFISLSGSQFVIDVINKLPNDYIFHDGVYSKEFCVYNEKIMMYDLVITEPVKKVIEFNGDYWHANPAKYKPDDLVPLRGGSKYAKDIWQMDKFKHNSIKARGFDVLIVWESEYLKNPTDKIQEVIEWIMN